MKKLIVQGMALIAFVVGAHAATIDYEKQIQPIFDASCIRCHGGAGGLKLEKDVSKNNLVGVISTNYAPALRVKMGDTTNSVLYHKINDTRVYGGVMPKDTGKMSQGNLDLIASWIAPKSSACTATLDGTLSLHIPYLSAVVLAQTLYLSADFVLDIDALHPQVVFKLTSAGFLTNPEIFCSPSTLSGDLKIRIPDLLLPDGVSHLWIEMEYDPVRSGNGNFYWNVIDYGYESD